MGFSKVLYTYTYKRYIFLFICIKYRKIEALRFFRFFSFELYTSYTNYTFEAKCII